MTSVTDWLNNVTTYDYDYADNLVLTQYPDGSAAVYSYDADNRLDSVTDYKPDGTVIGSYEYTFDPLGNRKTVSQSQQLTVVPKPQNVTYTYDSENRLQTAGNKSFSHDNNGNLTQETIGSSAINFAWDFSNMLTGITTGGTSYSYRYDGLLNRVATVANSTEKRYVVDRGTVFAETDASGSITAYYVYGLGLVSRITPDGHAYFYHYDGIGSAIAITDSTGAIVNKYAYDEFGNVLKSEETITNPFKYVGRFGVMDDGNGLYNMRARYYDPRTGRFISKDPIGLLGGMNPYSYNENNPVNFIDPFGLYSTRVRIVGGAIAVAAITALVTGGGVAVVAIISAEEIAVDATVAEAILVPLETTAHIGVGIGISGLGIKGILYGYRLMKSDNKDPCN